MSSSFYWHDYETFGIDPQRDRACQFAGIRTDMDFNLIGEPLMIYCQLPTDCLPDPYSCLITGITPQLANQQGVCEAAFIAQIHAQLAAPGTCGVGYNSLRFDDEVTRNLLYRNFYDPYAREWQQQNSRWDLIDLVRACYALRPDGIEWPVNEDGVVSLKLEALSKANAIHHQQAHDALSDVYATIGMARLIKQRQPKLYDYMFDLRHKARVLDLLQVGSFKPLVHVSGRYPNRKHCLAVVVPLGFHPRNDKEVMVYDLSADPDALLSLDAEQIRQRLFVASSDLAEGVERIALKTLHINKCPVLAPLNVLSAKDCQRLSIDLDRCQQHLQYIRADSTLLPKLREVYDLPYQQQADQDPELMIYSGGFFGQRDRQQMEQIRHASPEQLREFRPVFEDSRLEPLLFRYRARNFPETLNADEQQRWQAFCQQKLYQGEPSALEKLCARIIELKSEFGADHPLLTQLQQFADSYR